VKPKSVTIEMSARNRFKCNNKMLDSIYLDKKALIKQLGSDRISKVILTIEVEKEE